MRERLLVRDLMTIGVKTCSPDTPIREIACRLLDGDLEAVVILDEDGHGAGVITQDELVRAYAQPDFEALTAADILCPDVPEVPPDIPLKAAAQLMQDKNIRVFFLMHHGDGIRYPAAVISYKHFLRHLAASDDSELSDLGYASARLIPATRPFNRS
jgi:CBS domain-containing protein